MTCTRSEDPQSSVMRPRFFRHFAIRLMLLEIHVEKKRGAEEKKRGAEEEAELEGEASKCARVEA